MRKKLLFYFKRYLIKLSRLKGNPTQVALGLAIGTFVAFTPTVGLQMVIVLLLSFVIRFNRILGIAAVYISNPVTMVPLYYSTYRFGCFILNYNVVKLNRFANIFKFTGDSLPEKFINVFFNILKLGRDIFIPLWLGSIIAGLLISAIGFYFVYKFTDFMHKRRGKKLFFRHGKIMYRRVTLSYGNSDIILTIPKDNFSGHYKPKKFNETKDFIEVIQEKLTEKTDFLKQKFDNKNISFIIDDATRDTPTAEVLENVFPYFEKAESIKIFIATGSHNPDTHGNEKIIKLISKYSHQYLMQDKIKIINHNCDRNITTFINMGKTKRNTKIEINSEIKGTDTILILSNMKVHYFAGYSNPLKGLCPGITSYESIENNHSFAMSEDSTFGKHPLHYNEKKRTNPVAEDMYDFYQVVKKNYDIITLAFFKVEKATLFMDIGYIEEILPTAFKVIDDSISYSLNPVQNIIVSPGHHPNDESLYNSQRALELTKNAVKKNGNILFVSECKNGIGSTEKVIKNFYNVLKQDLDTILKTDRNDYFLYFHKAYKFAELLKKVNNIFFYTKIKKKLIDPIHLKKVKDFQKIIDDWIIENPDCKISVFDYGNYLSVYPYPLGSAS